jgi:hypothetical protein
MNCEAMSSYDMLVVNQEGKTGFRLPLQPSSLVFSCQWHKARQSFCPFEVSACGAGTTLRGTASAAIRTSHVSGDHHTTPFPSVSKLRYWSHATGIGLHIIMLHMRGDPLSRLERPA